MESDCLFFFWYPVVCARDQCYVTLAQNEKTSLSFQCQLSIRSEVVKASFTLFTIKMSVEIENELIKLKGYKHELLFNFYKFDDFENDEARINILNLINSFSESLVFLKAELQFEFDLDLSKPIRTHDTTAVQYAAEFDKDDQFLDTFKKNFVSKQLDIKESQLKKFQRLKKAKYGIKEEVKSSIEKDLEPIQEKPASTNTKIMSTTKKITSKLTQSSQILQSSLVQSQLNMDELTIQSDSLEYLGEKYGYLKTVLEKSDGFIKDIKLSSEQDKKKMYYALIFFALSVAWVIWRRLLKLPVMLAYYFIVYTLKLSLATFGIISRQKAEVDFVNPLSSTSLEQFATTSTEIVGGPEVFVTSAPEISEKADPTETIEVIEISDDDESSDPEDSEYDEALSKIIDEL